uniref:SCP domain-containing protein n=1 Tax=Cyprinus carpio carpio TaxID=630221 RepID=A0A8C1D8N7_CYPCA
MQTWTVFKHSPFITSICLALMQMKYDSHFTQVVWKDTNEVGVGLATDGNTTFVVGQYLPAGNISNAGYFERNVLPAAPRKSQCPQSSSSEGKQSKQTL